MAHKNFQLAQYIFRNGSWKTFLICLHDSKIIAMESS